MIDNRTILKNNKQINSIKAHIPKFNAAKKVYDVSSVIDQFQSMNESLIIDDGYKNIIGTSNPYQFNLFSDLITNPSSVSISEFQKMVYTQPILSAGLTIFNNLVINEIGKYQHENKKYTDFINDMLKNMDQSFDDIISNMLTMMWAGFSIGEKRYESDGRYIITKDIEPRPAQSFIYRVDSQGHLKEDGIIQYYFNNLWTGFGNMLAFNAVGQCGQQIPNPYASRGDFDYPWRTVWAQPIGTVIIPKSKCVHAIYKGLDGLTSPYGRSLLRAAYDSYLLRAELNRIARNAANFNAHPIPAIILDPNEANTEYGVDVLDDIAGALDSLGVDGASNPYLLLKGTKESVIIDKLDNTADLNGIVNMMEYYDKMLLTSILLPGELAGLSDKGSYALGKTQQDLLGRNITKVANNIKDCFIRQVVKPMLELNFNETKDFGAFLVNDNVSEDVALNMDKIGTLRLEGVKLKTEALMELMDINKEAVESVGNPIMEDGFENRGLNSNFNRTRGGSV